MNNKLHDLEKKLTHIKLEQDNLHSKILGLEKNILDFKNTDIDYKADQDINSTTNKVYDSISDRPLASDFDLKNKLKNSSITNHTINKTTHRQETYSDKAIIEKTKRGIFNIGANIENYIGENIISKLGILIIILGVSIGIKYSIEHNMINPTTRIILAYLTSFSLLVLAYMLKKNYLNYSGVLLSGASAILYTSTFVAYNLYSIISLEIAFMLMLIFTIFTCLASLLYNKQSIAQIGMVGAYAIPFLLGNKGDDILFLLIYISIINLGILILSVKKYWRPLNYVSFIFSYIILIFSIFRSSQGDNIVILLLFNLIFFVTFQISFLLYKLFKDEEFKTRNIVLFTTNSGLFFFLGIFILIKNDFSSNAISIFTLLNALIHYATCMFIASKNIKDKKLLYLFISFALMFISISIPMMVDGDWITLLWIIEALILFYIGRTKSITIFEKMAYLPLLLSVISILQDWSIFYSKDVNFILNYNILNFGAYISVLYLIYYVSRNTKSTLKEIENEYKFIKLLIPFLIISSMFTVFFLEILSYYNSEYIKSALLVVLNNADYESTIYNSDILKYETVHITNYIIIFFCILNLINIRKIKSVIIENIVLVVSLLSAVLFITSSLLEISELRGSYLDPLILSHYTIGIENISIRYISLLCFAILMLNIYFLRNKINKITKINYLTDIVLYFSLLWILTSELIHWMDMFNYNEIYKLVLSVFWGVYSLTLIIIGVWKRKKHIRIGAIVLFSFSLLKLFLYDISNLNTISKTIVFVSLGVLLLGISFIYTKFKSRI